MKKTFLSVLVVLGLLFLAQAAFGQKAEYRVFVPVVGVPELHPCYGDFEDDLKIWYDLSTRSTVLMGEITVPEEGALYLLLCRDAYRPDYPVLDGVVWIDRREYYNPAFLPIGHIVVVGPFEGGQVLEIHPVRIR